MDDAQVTVTFRTTMPEAYRITEAPFALPARLSRYGLSEVVNHLLALEKPVPFDFIVDGELVRASLQQLVLAKRLSAEAVLTVEYIPAVAPPQRIAGVPQPDWVSAVGPWSAVAAGVFVLTGCYDAIGRLTDAVTGRVACELRGHSDAITAVVPGLILPSAGGKAPLIAATASKDGTLRVWRLPPAAAKPAAVDTPPLEAAHWATLRGHGDAVECAAASPDGAQICSGGWDARVMLWTLPGEATAAGDGGAAGDPAGTPAKKRRRAAAAAAGRVGGWAGRPALAVGGDDTSGDGSGLAPADEVSAVSCRATLVGHSQVVSATLWPTSGTVVTASWDHTVRQWDAAAGLESGALHGTHAAMCLAAPTIAAPGAGLLAVGGADRCVRVWDPRAGATLAAAPALGRPASSDAIVAALAWSPTSAHHLAAGSADGALRLWDLRSSVPLHTVVGAHAGQVLCVAWTAMGVVTGGADCRLAVHTAAIGEMHKP